MRLEHRLDEADAAEADDVVINFADTARTASGPDASSITPFGQFTWAKTAVATKSVGGGNSTRFLSEETVAVVATTSSLTSDETDPDNTYQEIAFSFTGAASGASRIYWDPEAGIGYDVETVSASGGAGGAGSTSAGNCAASFAFACLVSVVTFVMM